MFEKTTELANTATLRQLVAVWQQAKANIYEANRLVTATEKLLCTEVKQGYIFHCTGSWRIGQLDDPEKMVAEMRTDMWRCIIERMEIRRFLSVAKAEELDKKLRNNDMPEITEDNVMEYLLAACQNMGALVKEQIVETHEFLRPRNNLYKTNSQFDVGKRVVLRWQVERKWGGKFDVRYGAEKNLRALDNVMHTLDGQGIAKTYCGPLVDAIANSGNQGTGETEYFKFRCCKNGNLHLEFKRMDLIQELNAIAGGRKMYQGKPEPQPAPAPTRAPAPAMLALC